MSGTPENTDKTTIVTLHQDTDLTIRARKAARKFEERVKNHAEIATTIAATRRNDLKRYEESLYKAEDKETENDRKAVQVVIDLHTS